VRADKLTKSVPSGDETLTILHEVSFSVNAGETLAIVGASGSGKSTLLGLLAGLDTPTSGSVELAGEAITSLDEDGRARVRAKSVGFVFQSFQLLPHLTALENTMLPLELAARANAAALAKSLLERVGLGARLQHYPKHLSGGEQQRVALARAFAPQPAILFADEPTGNLDAVTGDKIIELMFALNHEHGTTLVLVTHDKQIAERCARRITIEAGRVLPEA
jgi:putative ABC transport system ATP-binding protein